MEPTQTPTTPTPEPNAVPTPDLAAMPEPNVVLPATEPVTMPATETVSMSEQKVNELGATDPITMPSLPKPVDPVEEELKAPFKAAGPVPGSIGSAISMPAEGGASVGTSGQTPSVAFNDPATQQNPMAATAPVKAQKKFSNTTWILLGVLAVAVIGVLAYILIKMLNPGN